MFRNYLITGIRNLLRQKGYTLIHVLGLTLGISCFTLILLFIRDELSYDRYHEKAGRIYRLTEKIEPAEFSSSQPFSVAPAIAGEYPAIIEQAVRFFNMQAPTLTLENGPDRRFNESRFFFVDSAVFEVFSFPFLKGDPKTALLEPFSVVLTDEMAEKYFGQEDPMGKTLRFEGAHDLKITGILHRIPANSHFRFDFLASFSTVTGIQNGVKPEGWNWNPCWTYVLFHEGVPPGDLAARLPGFVQKFFPDNIREKTSLHLQALTDIHLHSHLDYEIEANSSITYMYIFSISAALILLIACINYMNLATARAIRRAREVGIRKVLGAQRLQLVRQFLGESFLLSFLAVALALPVIRLAVPVLNAVLDKSIGLNLSENGFLMASLLGTAIFVGFVAGIYPAFVLSAFRAAPVLKGRLIINHYNWTANLRKGLVIVQFAVSIALIIGTVVAYRQLQYLQQANTGIDTEQVVMVNIFRTNLASRYNDLKNRLLQNSHVLRVSTTEDKPGIKCQTNPFKPEGYTEFRQFQRLMVGYDFVETFNLSLVAGRSFNRAFPTDDSLAVLINEAMVANMGWKSPEEALGKGFSGRRRTQVVVGVLKDFHYTPLHHSIGPFVLDIADTESQHNFFDRYLAVRIAPAHLRETIGYLEKVWTEFMPEKPFEFFFMDDEMGKIYRAEARLGRVAAVFSIFALFVACLGLLGIVSYMTETRVKEIGIRKILGATSGSLVRELSGDFLKLVFIAFFIAVPVAWYLINAWLHNFAYRSNIPWWIYPGAGALAAAVAFLTVGIQSMRAALANPVKSLRSE